MTHALTLRINLDAATPAYRQIVDGIRVLLVGGKLAPGAELPSVRRMDLDLGVHFNPVAEAYRMLAEEGWLDLRHGRGARVVERDAPSSSPEHMDEFRRRLQSLVAEMLAKGASPKKMSSELLRLSNELKP